MSLRKRLIAIAILVGSALLGLSALVEHSARAQGGVVITENQAQLDFPRKLTFRLRATSEAEITRVYLLRTTSARTCSGGAARQEVKDFTPGKTVQAEWTWDFFDSGGLPPGAQVTWEWELRTASGETLRSEQQSLTLEDSRFTWKKLTRKNVTLAWAEGSQAFGDQLLRIAEGSLERIASQVGIQYTDPIRITVFPTFDDLRNALLFEPEWIGGRAYIEYSIIVSAIAPGELSWAQDVLPHELSHLVTGQVTFNCLGAYMSVWLNEGLAQLAERDLPSSVQERILADLKAGRLPSLKSLARGFPDSTEKSSQAYDFSYVVVDYLVKTYDTEKMKAVLEAIQAGKLTDQALLQVYGLDTEGIDQAWRAANGVGTPPKPATPGAASPTPQRTAIPTLALWTSVISTPTPEAVAEVSLPTSTATRAPTSALAAQPTDTAMPTSTTIPTDTATLQTTSRSISPLRCLGGAVPLLVVGVSWRLFRRRVSV